MPCPTCNGTMANLGMAGCGRTFWCQRCGTLKSEAVGAPDHISVPSLVGHVKEAEAMAVHPQPGGGVTYYAVPGWNWRAAREAVGLPLEV